MMVRMNSTKYYGAIQDAIHKQIDRGIYGTYDGASELLLLTFTQAKKECHGDEECINYWNLRRAEVTGREVSA